MHILAESGTLFHFYPAPDYENIRLDRAIKSGTFSVLIARGAGRYATPAG